MLRFALLLAPLAAAAAEVPLIPAARPAEFYTPLWQSSPFALATAAPATVEPAVSFAADWVVTGIGKAPDGRGAWVGIASRDRKILFHLVGDTPIHSHDPDVDGVVLTNVIRGKKAADYVVELRKGTETAKVKFGEEATAPTTSTEGSGGMQGTMMRPPSSGQPALQSGGGFIAPKPNIFGSDVIKQGRRSPPVLGGSGTPIVPTNSNVAPSSPNGATTIPTVRTRTIPSIR